MVGSKKRHIPFWTPFLPYNQSILCREKGLRQKNRYLLSRCFWFFVKFATANGGQQVTVGRGCLRGRFQNPWFLNRRGGCAQNITLFVTLQKCHSVRTELRHNKKREWNFKKFYESITCSQKKTFPERSGIWSGDYPNDYHKAQQETAHFSSEATSSNKFSFRSEATCSRFPSQRCDIGRIFHVSWVRYHLKAFFRPRHHARPTPTPIAFRRVNEYVFLRILVYFVSFMSLFACSRIYMWISACACASVYISAFSWMF